MSDTPSVDIDMTPMIDIVFQLITFFMVVINFDAADTDERVKMAISRPWHGRRKSSRKSNWSCKSATTG